MRFAYLSIFIVLLSACQSSITELSSDSKKDDKCLTNDPHSDAEWCAYAAKFPSIQCPFELREFSSYKKYPIVSKALAQKFIQANLQAKTSPNQQYRYVGKLEASTYWLTVIFVDPHGSMPGYFWAQTYTRSGMLLDQEVLAGHWGQSCQSLAIIQSPSIIEIQEMGLSDTIMTCPEPLVVKINYHIDQNGRFIARSGE